MTMTSPKRVATAGVIQWTIVQPGLWVAKVNGEFAGMIEADDGGAFRASSRLAQSVGIFPTIDAAKASFTA